jgi:acetylornithine aminotransferase
VENATIVVMEKAWHGRTLATLSATARARRRPGSSRSWAGSCACPTTISPPSRRLAENSSIVAVLLEVLQGEGGIHVADAEYVRKLRELCDRKQWLLMIDEVQSGIGTHGKWFRPPVDRRRSRRDAACQGPGFRRADRRVPCARRRREGVQAGQPRHHLRRRPARFSGAITTLDVIEKEGLMKNAEAMGHVIMDA